MDDDGCRRVPVRTGLSGDDGGSMSSDGEKAAGSQNELILWVANSNLVSFV